MLEGTGGKHQVKIRVKSGKVVYFMVFHDKEMVGITSMKFVGGDGLKDFELRFGI